MIVDIYQTNEKGTFLFLPPEVPFSSVPRSVLDTVGLLQFLNTLEVGMETLGVTHSEILADIERQGYSLHEARFKILDQGDLKEG